MAMPTLEQFYQILSNLMSIDNDVRRQSEEVFKQLQEQPAWLLPALLHIISQAPDAGARQMAGVLLRRTLGVHRPDPFKADGDAVPVFSFLSAEQQQQIKNDLLTRFAQEPEMIVRKALVYGIATLASQLVDEGKWPELFPALFTGVEHGDAATKKLCVIALGQLTHYLEESLAQHAGTLRQALDFALGPQNEISVRVSALDAATKLANSLPSQHVNELKSLLTSMGQALSAAIGSGDTDLATSAIEAFIALVESTPQFINESAQNVLGAMMSVAAQSSLAPEVRRLAMEFILTYAEGEPMKAKKLPGFVQKVFELAMQFMFSIPDQQNWGFTEEDEDEDEEEMQAYLVGLECVDRISLALRGKTIEPIASKAIASALSSSEWKQKHAGLNAIGQIAEGCHNQMTKNLGAVVQMVQRHLDDPVSQVRWAAVNALGQFCVDFKPGLQATLHGIVLPGLMKMLGDPVPRVQAAACVGIEHFMEDAEIEFVEKYLDELMTKLMMVCTNIKSQDRQFVLIQALGAISQTAEKCEEKFAKYYDHIVPYLKQLLTGPAVDRKHRYLRATVIQCLTQIGGAVGKEKFAADSRDVMNLLQQAQSTLEADDPQASHLLEAWARVAKVLGDDFAPYLNHVMAPLFNQAGLKTDVEVVDATDQGSKNEEEGVQVITLAIKGVGDKTIRIRTSMLEDKSYALSVLHMFLQDLPVQMFQYVPKAFEICIPLLRYAYSEDIRENASKIVALCVASAKAFIEKNGVVPNAPTVKQLFDQAIPALIKAATVEPEPDVLGAQMSSIREILESGEKDCMEAEGVKTCAGVLKQVFEESMKRRHKVLTQKAEVEEDEDEVQRLENEEEGEEQLLNEAMETIGYFIKHQPRHFIAHFTEHFLPMCRELLQNQTYGDVERRLALCVFDDLMEHGPDETVKPIGEDLVKCMLHYATVTDPDVVQSAAYGLGLCARRLKEIVQNPEVLKVLVERLKAIVANPKAKEEEYQCTTANAVSSLVHVYDAFGQHPSGLASGDAIFPSVLNALPVQGDEVEACFVHGRLADYVLQGNAAVLGPNNSALPKLCEFFATLKDTEFVDENGWQKMEHIMQRVASGN